MSSFTFKSLNHLLSLFLSFTILCTSFLIQAQEETDKTVTAVAEFKPGHQIILTNFNGAIGVDTKADAIKKILELAPPNKVIYLVFKPTNQNHSSYRTLSALINAAIDKAKKEKNIRVEVIFVNDEIAQMTSEYILSQNPEVPNYDTYVKLQKDDVWFLDDAPDNLVERIDQNKTFLSPAWSVLKGTLRETGEAIKDTKWSGLILATTSTILGASTLAPSWVYISEGELTLQSATVLAMSAAYLYSAPRNEKLTRKLYEFGFEVARSGMNFFKYLGNKVNYLSDRTFYLNEAKPYQFYGFRAAASGLYSIPFLSLAYYLKDGTEIANPEYLEYIFRNSILLGTASAPWSFVTEKLKADTSLSKNLITHLRTVQLVSIGALAVGIPYGIDSLAFSINSAEEAMLLGLGATGTALAVFNKPFVKIINKLDKNKWFRWTHRNYEALTNAGPNFISNIFRKLMRKRPIKTDFLSLNRAEDEINVIKNMCGNYLR